MFIPNGCILLSRNLIESEIWKKPPLYVKVWVYLLIRAQHKEYKGLKRGQARTSISEIREACSYYVGYRKVTPTKNEIWKIIEWMRNQHEEDAKENNESNMIETTKGTQGMIVTICNYNIYQSLDNYERDNESDGESDNEKVTKETAAKQYKQEYNKNNKNNKNDNPYFYNIVNDESRPASERYKVLEEKGLV